MTDREVCVEFPDEELAQSPSVGGVFRIPAQIKEDTGSESSDYDDRRPYMRPHSAKGPNLEVPTRVLPTKPRGIRPWSAQPKSSKIPAPSQRRISRETLRKPHLKPPARSPTQSISSETSSLITAVGLANNLRRPLDASTPEPKTSLYHSKCSHHQDKQDQGDGKLLTTIADAISESQESISDIAEKPDPAQRSLRKYSSFDTWVEGSPHDSEEYDTDLDIEEYVKKNVTEERPLDPTGTVMYMDQCSVQGTVPVSYIQRHLGDKNFKMRHHYLGGPGTKPVAIALVKNTVTETLDISDNYVETEGARYLSGMMKHNTFIVNLNISNNFIGREGFACICRMLETNTTLKSLCISGNQLTDLSAQYLIEGLKNNTSLTSLDLSGNSFGEMGGAYLGGALSVNEGLIDVDLSWNSIRNRGAAALLSCLTKNKTIEVMDLSWNGLGKLGSEALKTALKINTTLKVLDLSNNRLDVKAAEAISWGLTRNKSLETLVLNMNPFKDAGVEAILKAAEKCQTLQLLSIEEIGISRDNHHKIQELQTQRDLTILHGGVGGYTRVSTATSMIRLFSKFVRSHSEQLVSSFQQFDRDRNGKLGLDDLKLALKEAGLRLTNRQLSTVIDELNYSSSNTMDYREILDGSTLREYFARRPARKFALKMGSNNMNTVPDMLRRQLTVS